MRIFSLILSCLIVFLVGCVGSVNTESYTPDNQASNQGSGPSSDVVVSMMNAGEMSFDHLSAGQMDSGQLSSGEMSAGEMISGEMVSGEMSIITCEYAHDVCA